MVELNYENEILFIPLETNVIHHTQVGKPGGWLFGRNYQDPVVLLKHGYSSANGIMILNTWIEYIHLWRG